MNHLNTYVEQIKEKLGSRIKSVFIYGSAAKLKLEDLKSNVNVAIIVEDLSGDDLKECAKATSQWMRHKNPVPVFIPYAGWLSVSGTYAMEYADIKDSHILIYGEDIISPITVHRHDLQFQCEHEVRNLLMVIRKQYLIHAHSKNALKKAFISFTKTFTTIFRTVLRIKDVELPICNEEVVRTAATCAGLDENVFLRLLEYKNKCITLKNDEVDSLVNALLSELFKLAKYLNQQ